MRTLLWAQLLRASDTLAITLEACARTTGFVRLGATSVGYLLSASGAKELWTDQPAGEECSATIRAYNTNAWAIDRDSYRGFTGVSARPPNGIRNSAEGRRPSAEPLTRLTLAVKNRDKSPSWSV
jgi:hypothetical protein